jgi:hypothetical protein
LHARKGEGERSECIVHMSTEYCGPLNCTSKSYKSFGGIFCLHVVVTRLKAEGPGELFYLANKRHDITSDLTSDSYLVKIQYVSDKIQIHSHKE